MTIRQIKQQILDCVKVRKNIEQNIVKSVSATKNKRGLYDVVIEIDGSVTERELKRSLWKCNRKRINTIAI